MYTEEENAFTGWSVFVPTDARILIRDACTCMYNRYMYEIEVQPQISVHGICVSALGEWLTGPLCQAFSQSSKRLIGFLHQH